MTEDSADQNSTGREVFVSYASQDAAVANSVIEALERQGIQCWIAPRDVKPGAQYADAIVRAINEAKTLVLVLSQSSVGSSHVGREVERAASKHKRIVALKVDAAPLTPALEYFLSESQWIDVPALGMPAALAMLTEAAGRGSAAGQVNPVPGSNGVSRAVGTSASDEPEHGHGLSIKIPFLEQLKRRHVGRVAVLYVGVCYLILEFFSTFLHVLALPEWTGRTLAALMVAGFPVVLLLAWIFEVTPQGIKPTAAADSNPSSRKLTGRRLDFAIIIVLVLALGYFAADKFWLSERPVKTASAPEATGSAAVTPVGPIISDKSIAVLPFEDLSEKHDQEYFSEGIAEEILDRLTKVPELRVVGRASSFQFKGRIADSAGIGTALGVAYLLEGSVRKESERIRVSAQLIEARTGAPRWSDRFDSEVLDVLGVQDRIAIEISRALQIAVEANSAHRTSVKSPQVLDAYLRGLQSENRNSRESLEAAVADFQQALTLDPTFAPAAISVARTDAFIGAQGWLPPRIAFERAREAAALAQRLDPKSGSPHVSMAQILIVYDWNWEGAEHELQTAFGLGPRDSYAVQTASWLAAARGQWEEARHLGIEAVELDPLDPTAHIILAWYVYLHTGQFAEAEQSVRRGLQIAPKWGTGQYVLGQTLLLQGQHAAALTEFRKETLNDGQLEGSSMAYYAAGHKTESDSQLVEAIRHNGESWPSEIARVYAFRGERDHAFEWLNRAYQARDQDLYLIKGDPLFKNLEGDSRYRAFLKKMNLPE